MKLSIAILAAGLGLGGSAWAAEPVASAGGTGAAPVAPDTSTDTSTRASTAAQIDAFLKAAPIPDLPSDGPTGVTATGPEPRQIHGMVEVGAGSDGYRHAFVAAEIPLRQTGTLGLAIDQTQFKGRYGGWGGGQAWRGQTLAGSLAFGAAAQDPTSSSPCESAHPGGAAERWASLGPACRARYGAAVDPLSGPPPR